MASHGRGPRKSSGYLFRCSASELDELHEQAAELRTSVQALMEHKLLGKPLETERARRRASRQEQLPIPDEGIGLTG